MKFEKSPTGRELGKSNVPGRELGGALLLGTVPNKVPGREKTQLRYGPTGKPQHVKSRGYHWCEGAEEEFFDILAASCNVTLACEEVGFATPTVYRFRRLRPEFAARWDAALNQGYARLEMELLRAANDSLDDKPFDESRPIPKMTVDQAMNVLRAHRNSVDGNRRAGPGKRLRPRTLDEVKDSIRKKVSAIKTVRDAGQELGPT